MSRIVRATGGIRGANVVRVAGGARHRTAWYVVPSGAGKKDGTSWSNAFEHPQDGVDAAFAHHNIKEVWVANGTYVRQGAATNVVVLEVGVSLYGSFVGNEGSVSQRNLHALPPTACIIDAEDLARGVFIDGRDTILDGFHIRRGVSGAFYDDGGGVHATALGGAAPYNKYIRNCIIEDCEAAINGGGIAAAYTDISNCLIYDNRAATRGAGVWVSWGDRSIFNCTMDGNIIPGNPVSAGEGLHVQTGTTQIVNCILWENGSIEVNGGEHVTYCDVKGGYAGVGNIAADPLYAGGGDYHLQAGSPCRNTGTSTGAPARDLDGAARPSGAGVDMGCYEYQE